MAPLHRTPPRSVRVQASHRPVIDPAERRADRPAASTALSTPRVLNTMRRPRPRLLTVPRVAAFLLALLTALAVAGCSGSDSGDDTPDTRPVGSSSSDEAVAAMVEFYVKDGTFSQEQAQCIADAVKDVVDVNAYLEFVNDPNSGVPALTAEQTKAQSDAVTTCVEKFPTASTNPGGAPASTADAQPAGDDAATTVPSVLTPEPPTVDGSDTGTATTVLDDSPTTTS